MAIPFISGLDLIVSASGSDCIINKSADIASPCLIPLKMGKYCDKRVIVLKYNDFQKKWTTFHIILEKWVLINHISCFLTIDRLDILSVIKDIPVKNSLCVTSSLQIYLGENQSPLSVDLIPAVIPVLV